MVTTALRLGGWTLLTLGVFALAAPFLPEDSPARTGGDHWLVAAAGVPLLVVGAFLAHRYRINGPHDLQ